MEGSIPLVVQEISCFVASASKGRSSLPCTHDYLTHPFPQHLHSVHMTLPEVQWNNCFCLLLHSVSKRNQIVFRDAPAFFISYYEVGLEAGFIYKHFQMCDSRKYPYTPPPPTDGQWKFLGGRELKGKNFRGVQGCPREEFSTGLWKTRSIARDILKYMWIILICSTTKIRSRYPFEKKKPSRNMSQTSSLLGVPSHLRSNDLF